MHAGDLLAQIDPRPYQASIDQYDRKPRRDQAQLKNAQANLTRYTTLGGKGWATPQLIEPSRRRWGKLHGGYQDRRMRWLKPRRCSSAIPAWTSPIDGVVGIDQIDVGNIIRPTNTNGLVDVTQIDPISLIFTLPEPNSSPMQRTRSTKVPSRSSSIIKAARQLDEGNCGLVNNEIMQTTGSIQLEAISPTRRTVCGRATRECTAAPRHAA